MARKGKRKVIDVERTLMRAFEAHTEDPPTRVELHDRRVRMCYREPWGTTDHERDDCFERPLAAVVRFLRECRDGGCDEWETRDFVRGKHR